MPLAAVTSAPFDASTLSEEVVLHESWRQASKEALSALRREASVVVLGLPGTGKTFLLQSLGQRLRSGGWRVRSLTASQLPDPKLQTDILLADEVDCLPGEALDALRDWSGLFIAAGSPEIAPYLERRACAVVTVTLEPLSPEDVARFVASRLSRAGYRRDLLEPDAVLALSRHSAGLLRLVDMLAGSAMFLAEREGAERVSKRHVDEAAAMRESGDSVRAVEADLARLSRPIPRSTVTPMLARLEPESHSASSSRANRVALGLGGLLLLGELGWVLLPSQHPRHPPELPQHKAALTFPSTSVPLALTIPTQPSVAQPPATPLVPPLAVPPAPFGLPSNATALSLGGSERSAPSTPSRPNESVQAFKGPILNETMNQTGQLSLDIRRSGPSNLTMRFQASAGLIGSGNLIGTITADGRLIATGRLMMGRNPFTASIVATLVGDRLKGTAIFTRPETDSTARSRFDLSRF
jgi:hypothetical protein